MDGLFAKEHEAATTKWSGSNEPHSVARRFPGTSERAAVEDVAMTIEPRRQRPPEAPPWELDLRYNLPSDQPTRS